MLVITVTASVIGENFGAQVQLAVKLCEGKQLRAQY